MWSRSFRGGASRGEGLVDVAELLEPTSFENIDSILARIRFEGSSLAGSGETRGDTRCRFVDCDEAELDERSRCIIVDESYVELRPAEDA